MPTKNDVFSKPHLTPADLGDKSFNLKIREVQNVEVYDFKKKRKVMKPALYFKNAKKFMILNETNWDKIADILGLEDSDDWAGHNIVVYAADLMVGGEPVKGLRITDSPSQNTVEETPDPLPPTPAPVTQAPSNETAEEARARIAERTRLENEEHKQAVEKNAW